MDPSEQEIIDNLNAQIADLSHEVSHLISVIDDLMSELHDMKLVTGVIDKHMGDSWLSELADALAKEEKNVRIELEKKEF